MTGSLLDVQNLTVRYRSRSERSAADGVSFQVARGERLAIVGESGSGKTTTIRAILRLLPPSADVSGRVLFDGDDLLSMGQRKLQALRWKQMALVPQSAMNSLDPVRTVTSQFAEVVRMHTKDSRKQAQERVADALTAVGLDPSRGSSFPHQLSGGQRQRAMIALASILHPRLLIADEPTTGLDVIVQDQVLASLASVVQEQGLTAILVTHDLGVAAEFCDRLIVMKDGRIVEAGPTHSVVANPQHPYSQALIAHKRLPLRDNSMPESMEADTTVPTEVGQW